MLTLHALRLGIADLQQNGFAHGIEDSQSNINPGFTPSIDPVDAPPKEPSTVWSLTDFRMALPYTPIRFRSTVYLALIVFGAGLFAIGAVVLPFLEFSWENVFWFAVSFAVAFGCFFDFFYQEVVHPSGVWRSVLDCVILGAWLVLAAPVFYTALGDWMLVGMMMGWMLSWFILGVEVYRFKKAAERAGIQVLTGPVFDVQTIPEKRARMVFISIVFIVLSTGIMFWMLIDMAIDPSYEFIETSYDWIPWSLWFMLYVGALGVLYLAVKRMQARLLMMSALMAALSWTGFLCVIAQLLIWQAHRRYELPWGKEDASGRVWLSDDRAAMSRSAALIGSGLIAGAASLAGYSFTGWLDWALIIAASIVAEAALLSYLSRRSRRTKEDRLG